MDKQSQWNGNATGNMQVEKKFANVNGFTMHYLQAGEGIPVVLLHGWPETSYAWRYVIPLLADRYTLIAPDLRGLGESGQPDTGYDKKALADDIYQLVRLLGHQQIYLVAHDWGAPVAYELACAHPETVRKLVILDMMIPDASLEQRPLLPREGKTLWWFAFHMVKELPEMLVKDREEVYLKWFYTNSSYNKKAFTDEVIREYGKSYAAPGKMAAGFNYYRSIFQDIDNQTNRGASKLAMPVLAVGGDKSYGMATYHHMCRLAEDVTGRIISDCGHYIAEEQPEALAMELISFLQ